MGGGERDPEAGRFVTEVVWTVQIRSNISRTSAALIGGLCLICLPVLSGCGGGSSKPAAGPAASQSPAASAPAQASQPLALPTDAAQRTTQGAASFAGYWWRAVNQAYQQMDVTSIRAYALPSCATCARLIDGTERDVATGARYAGGAITLQSVKTLSVANSGVWLRTVIQQQELKIADHTGKVVRTTKAQTTPFNLGLVWTKVGWRVAALNLAA